MRTSKLPTGSRSEEALVARVAHISETVFSWAGELLGEPDLPPPRLPEGWGAEDWRLADRVCMVHGIGPLFGWRLEHYGDGLQLDEGFRNGLRNRYRLNCARTAKQTAALERIAGCASDDLSIIPLKGSQLISRYYREPGIRPMADIDLLVRPQDEPRLARALEAAGYYLRYDVPRHRVYYDTAFEPIYRSLKTPSVAHFAQGIAHPLLDHPDNPCAVEVHASLSEDYLGRRIDFTQDYWRHLESGEANGVLRFARGPMLAAHIAFHVGRHLMLRTARFIFLFDLRYLLNGFDGRDWEVFLELVRRHEAERYVYAVLSLAERYLGRFVPADVRSALAQGMPRGVRSLMRHRDLYELSRCNPDPIPLLDMLRWLRFPTEWPAFARAAMDSQPPAHGVTASGTRRSRLRRIKALAERRMRRTPRADWQIFLLD